MVIYEPLNDPEYEEYDRANMYMFRQDYDQAETELKRGLHKGKEENNSEKVAFYYSALGTLSLQKGDYQTANVFYQKASVEDPSNDLYRISIATTFLYFLNQPQDALHALVPLLAKEKILSIAMYHYVNNLKGECLIKLMKTEEALAILDSLSRINFQELFKTQASFSLAKELAKKNIGREQVNKYVQSALASARKINDVYHIDQLEEISKIIQVQGETKSST